MSTKFLIPENYQPVLDAMETEKAINLIKDFFQMNLAEALNLRPCLFCVPFLHRTMQTIQIIGKIQYTPVFRNMLIFQ